MSRSSCPTWESELAKLASGFSSQSDLPNPAQQVHLFLTVVCQLSKLNPCMNLKEDGNCCCWSNILDSGDLDVWSNRAQPWQLSGEIPNQSFQPQANHCLNSDFCINFNFSIQAGFGGYCCPLVFNPWTLLALIAGIALATYFLRF